MFFASEEGPSPVLPDIGELIIGLIAFAILAFVLMKFVFPKLEATYQARVEAIEGGIKRAEAAQAEANELLAEYKTKLAEAHKEAAAIREDARVDGQRIIAELRTEAQAESARIVARGNEQLDAQRRQLVAELRNEIGTLAVDLAGRIVGESLADDARRAGTVDRFLADLDSADSSVAGGR